jgi:phosphoserine aminotransferase
MNITFNLPSTELEKKFLTKALKNGLGGLKGHRDARGLRVSTYNASTIKGIKALIKFMDRFQKDNNQ